MSQQFTVSQSSQTPQTLSHNLGVQGFEVLRFLIFDFFPTGYQEISLGKSTYGLSKDVANLLLVSRSLYYLMIGQYMRREYFSPRDKIILNPGTLNLVQNFCLIIKKGLHRLEYQDQIDHWIRQIPLIKKLRFTGCEHQYKQLLDILNQRSVPHLVELEHICWRFFDGKCCDQDPGTKICLVSGSLPRTLLKMNFESNQYLEPYLFPPNLSELIFGSKFNKKIGPGVLPQSIRSLEFGDNFNKKIKPMVLPQGIRELRFGDNFNQKIEPGILPLNLQSLVFSRGNQFNQTLEIGSLPQNLKKLSFGHFFNRPLVPGVLPISLRDLDLGYCFNQSLVHSLPNGLSHLSIHLKGHELDFLPKFVNIRSLELWGSQRLEPGIIPGSVKKLSIQDRSFNQSLEHLLPSGLVELVLDSEYPWKHRMRTQSGDRFLPLTLRKLGFNHILGKYCMLPPQPQLEHLDFGQEEYENGQWVFKDGMRFSHSEWIFLN
jgi:hypothetical protein